MKKTIVLMMLCLFCLNLKMSAQEDNSTNRRVITTGVPFVLIAADPRAASMGDMGVGTSTDAFSQQWNPAKYAFALPKQGVGVTYTPYLSNLVNDIFLGNITYFNRLNERSAVAASFRYFSLGEIDAISDPSQADHPLILSPNELTFDVSYSLRLGEQFAMAVAGRYLRSDLKLQIGDEDASAGSSFAVDIAGYYQSEETPYNSFDGRWRAGFNISNIGPAIKYDETGQENYLPTNLGIGGGFDFILDMYNRIGVTAEFNKLLVPTPSDSNNDGVIDPEDDYYGQSFFSGMFSSFGDAPDGFSEELKEITWALGAEYVYDNVFALRTGYFNESDEKGGRKFMSIGAGFKYTSINIDLSYLFSTSNVRSPLEGTLRFGLTFNIADNTYIEY